MYTTDIDADIVTRSSSTGVTHISVIRFNIYISSIAVVVLLLVLSW